MTALARWRAGALVAMAAGALLPLVLAQRARGRYERALAAREATAAAGYLTIVTPLARGGAGYDLPQLLIRARALEELPGFSGRFEIYHATAPLVRATAPPLAAATLQRLRREVAVRWTGDAALAPLLDRDGWDVVGAVAARPAAGIWRVSPWALGALLLLLVAGTQSVAALGAAGGVRKAAVAVRRARGRGVGLGTPPAGGGTAGWLPVMLGLAALGPLGALLAAWSTATAPRPRRETVAAWGFLAPSALHLAAFSFVPLLVVLYVSVHDWSPIEPSRAFVALANYGHVVRDPVVWSALGRTLLYALYVPVSMALALGLAVMIGGRRRSGAAPSVLRALFLLPYASSVVAVALVWQWMYHPDFGLINQLLTRAGLGRVNWLGDPKAALGAVMLVSVWMQLGYQLAVFLAGLRAIPRAYLDAARVDGANAWQRFWRVTFPLLSPVMLFLLVTGIIGAFQVFALVIVLTGGGPLGATDVIVYRIYRTAWELLQFGDASAMALLLFAVLFGVTWVQLKLLDRRVEHA